MFRSNTYYFQGNGVIIVWLFVFNGIIYNNGRIIISLATATGSREVRYLYLYCPILCIYFEGNVVR